MRTAHVTICGIPDRDPMRGTMSYQMRGRGEGEPVRMQIGDQSVGAEFENAPSLFLEYAHKHWNTFAVEERYLDFAILWTSRNELTN